MARLSTLRKKLARRKKSRDRQTRLWEETKEAGHGKAAKRHARAVRKLKRLIEKAKERLSRQTGRGPWAGTQSIIEREVIPVGNEWGIPVTSTKRSETYGNPSSDHWIGNRGAYAADFATDSNYEFGRAIGKALGVPYSGVGDDYREFFITRSGFQFRVQIICQTHGTGPHTHVGIRRV